MLEKVFENKTIRTVIKDDGVWFVAKDVAACLGYEKANKAIADHVDDDDKAYLGMEKLESKTEPSFDDINPKELGQRGGWLINESGMYALIFGSKLEAAKRFKRWVTHEVLPSIRKNGFYVSENITPGQLARLKYTVKNQQKKLHMLEAQNEILDKQNDKLIEALARKTSSYKCWYYGK